MRTREELTALIAENDLERRRVNGQFLRRAIAFQLELEALDAPLPEPAGPFVETSAESFSDPVTMPPATGEIDLGYLFALADDPSEENLMTLRNAAGEPDPIGSTAVRLLAEVEALNAETAPSSRDLVDAAIDELERDGEGSELEQDADAPESSPPSSDDDAHDA
jgi:hypothetical protein